MLSLVREKLIYAAEIDGLAHDLAETTTGRRRGPTGPEVMPKVAKTNPTPPEEAAGPAARQAERMGRLQAAPRRRC